MGRTKLALQKQSEARRLRSSGRAHDNIHANSLERQANDLLAAVPSAVVLTETLPLGESNSDTESFFIRDTLENPDSVAVEASDCRMNLLVDADALETASTLPIPLTLRIY